MAEVIMVVRLRGTEGLTLLVKQPPPKPVIVSQVIMEKLDSLIISPMPVAIYRKVQV